MANPRVNRFTANDNAGIPQAFTVSNEIIDHFEAARTFGREDLADPAVHGRFQRRVIALPDRRYSAVAPMMLSIGNQNGLYLARKEMSADSGWSMTDLGASISSAVGGATQVRAVSAGWTDDDRITVAVAVDDGPGQIRSRVFVAYNLSSAASDWSRIAWSDCGTRENVRIEGIRVLDEGDDTWTVVLAGSKGPNEAIYLLRSDRTPSFAGALVFNPAVSLEDILDFEIGVHPTYGGGLHVLGIGSGSRVLAFRPFPAYDSAGKPTTIPPVVGLPCPAGANVLETGLTTEDGSNLYIGGQGLQLIQATELDNAETAQTVQIVDATAAANVQDLAAGEAADGSVSVWALLQNGDLNVVRRAGANDEWGPSLRLRSGVQEMAPIPGDNHSATSILVVYGDAQAAYIWQDGAANVWQEAPVNVADPGQVMKVTCYGTTLRLLDDAGVPRQGVNVSVTASVLSSVSLNGNAVLIGPDQAVTATTDMNGGINVYNRVRSLTPAVYRFTVDGIDGHVDVNPASGVFDKFASMTADELRSATVSTPSGDVPLLPDNFRTGADSSQVDAVAGSLNQAAKLAMSVDGSAPDARIVQKNAPFSSALRADALPDSFRWGIQADASGVRVVHDDVISKLIGAAESAERFFVNLGHTIADFFEGIGEKAKEAVTFVLHKAEGAFRFICAIGDKIKKFVLTTLEEAGAFFKWLWTQVKTGLEKLWEYLKFLFRWEDIVLVRNAMVEATDAALTSVRQSIGGLKTQVADGFDKAIVQIEQWRTGGDGVVPAKPRRPEPGQSVIDDLRRAASPIQKVMDDVQGNSIVGWVTQRIGRLMDDIVHVEGPSVMNEAVDAADRFVEGLLSDEINDLMATWNKLQSDIGSLFGGKVPAPSELNFRTIKDALVTVGADLLEGVLTGLRDFVLRTIDLMQDLIGIARDALFAKISFPFIEKLVELVAPGTHLDTSFRLVDGMMLLCAIPATIAYKLIAGEAPFKKGDVIAFPFGEVTVQSDVDELRKFSWVGGLTASFIKLIIAGYQAYVQGSIATSNGKSEPTAAWKLWVGAGFGAVGVVAEKFGMHVDKGEEVSAMEWTMLALSGLMASKTVALLLAENKPGADAKTMRKINSGIDLVGSVVHFIFRTAVFGKVIDDTNKSETDNNKSNENLTETLAWMQSLFDHAGTSLLAAAGLDDDEETKAMLLIGGGAGKGLSFVLNMVRVPVSINTGLMMTN
ncbi:hypothetical protein GZH47_00265 [Paenibacillus rhizovicinus]|uniref:Uncharacterized protein n=1 Tax=Paenibacillus rhizovicinus TaxID=2704463 RepID=A0A6C0NT94_9BACL|nr:hypothetical protein [Paenibacillus rhizovicinus]QHW29414.1 hypothetical protein GZH47_00265 [Paenibacillus rhizovicinus]